MNHVIQAIELQGTSHSVAAAINRFGLADRVVSITDNGRSYVCFFRLPLDLALHLREKVPNLFKAEGDQTPRKEYELPVQLQLD